MSYRSILLCPDEHTQYQLSYMDKKSDAIIALSSSLDYELPEGAVLLSRDAQSSERISIPHCSELLKHAACVKLIYCALSVSEYLSMLYFCAKNCRFKYTIFLSLVPFRRTILVKYGALPVRSLMNQPIIMRPFIY